MNDSKKPLSPPSAEAGPAPGAPLPRRARAPLEAGTWAGLYGGVLMAAYMALLFLVNGRSIWLAAKLPALPFVGEAALEPGFQLGPVVLGFVVHFAVSMFWGAIFALTFAGYRPAMTFFWGALYGVVVWAVMVLLVLPVVGGAVVDYIGQKPSLVPHVLFGLALALALAPFQRTWSRSRSRSRRRRGFARRAPA